MSQPILSRTGILSYLDDDSREAFTSYGSWLATEAGQVLIREGEINRHLYIVGSGIFGITAELKGQQVTLDSVSVGDCLGEVSVFDPELASATVTSLTEGQLWAIDAESLQQFLSDSPGCGCAVILGIDVILARRLRHATSVIRSHAIVPGFLSVRSQARAKSRLAGES